MIDLTVASPLPLPAICWLIGLGIRLAAETAFPLKCGHAIAPKLGPVAAFVAGEQPISGTVTNQSFGVARVLRWIGVGVMGLALR